MTNLDRLKSHTNGPKDATFAREAVQMVAERTRQASARLAMAKLAVQMGNYDAAGLAVWQEYLDAGAPKA